MLYYEVYTLIGSDCMYIMPPLANVQLRGPREVETIADELHDRLVSVSGFIL